MEHSYAHAQEQEDGTWLVSDFWYQPLRTYDSPEQILKESLEQQFSVKFSNLATLKKERAYLEQWA